MKRKVSARRPSAAMLVAVVALISSLTGGAVAATLITGDDIARNAVATKHIKKNAVNTKKVKDGSLLKKDFKPGQLVAGAPGPQGLKGDPCPSTDPACVGPKGDKGDTGPAGPTGPAGTNGTNGTDGDDFTIASTLQSGQTLTGGWGAWGMGNGAGGDDYLFDAQTFRVPLAADIPAANVHYGADATCTGTPTNPSAPAGHLCVYITSTGNATFQNIIKPGGGATGADQTGFSVWWKVPGADGAHAYGSWAVTAP